jgi:hypothetical protein
MASPSHLPQGEKGMPQCGDTWTPDGLADITPSTLSAAVANLATAPLQHEHEHIFQTQP